MSNYHVKTDVFEGPLELLLNLIEKRKLLINEISLAKVADDYIEFIKSHPEFPLGQTAHFILVASTLVLIKSKSLLPQLELSEEEQESVEDLELRLKLYQRFRDLGKVLQQQFGSSVLFSRTFTKVDDPVFVPDKETNQEGMSAAISRVLLNLPKEKEAPPKTVVKKVVSLEEMIDSLTDRIQSTLKMSFRDFSGHGKKERVHVVVGFLAMLELVKQGMIRVEQEARFSDILMESDNVSTPNYG